MEDTPRTVHEILQILSDRITKLEHKSTAQTIVIGSLLQMLSSPADQSEKKAADQLYALAIQVMNTKLTPENQKTLEVEGVKEWLRIICNQSENGKVIPFPIT